MTTATKTRCSCSYFCSCAKPHEERQLAKWAAEEQLIELVIYYPCGSVRLVDRVRHFDGYEMSRAFLTVGEATLPVDAVVYRESVGQAWVWNCRQMEHRDF